MMHAAILTFCILTGAQTAEQCAWGAEDGIVHARSCAAAEAYIRAGLRPGQRLVVLGCETR